MHKKANKEVLVEILKNESEASEDFNKRLIEIYNEFLNLYANSKHIKDELEHCSHLQKDCKIRISIYHTPITKTPKGILITSNGLKTDEPIFIYTIALLEVFLNELKFNYLLRAPLDRILTGFGDYQALIKEYDEELSNCTDYKQKKEIAVEINKLLQEIDNVVYNIKFLDGLLVELVDKHDLVLKKEMIDDEYQEEIVQNLEKYYEGDAYFDLGMYKEALSKYKEEFKYRQNDYKYLANVGWAYLKNNDYKNAAVFLKKSIELNEGFAFARNGLGFLYFKTGKFNAAIKEFLKSVEIAASRKSLYFAFLNLGHIKAVLKEYNDAIFYFKESMKCEPNNFEPYFNIATVYFNLFQYDKALNYYKKAIMLNPDDKKMQSYALVCEAEVKLKDKKFEDVIKIYKNSIKYYEDEPIFYNNLAGVYSKTNQLKKAKTILNKAIKLDKNFFVPIYNLAYVYQKSYEFKKAIEFYNRCLGENIKTSFTMNERKQLIYPKLSWCYYALEDKDKSFNFLKTLIEDFPNYLQAYNYLAYFYWENNFSIKADEFSKFVLNIEKNDAFANLVQALIKIEKGDIKSALKKLDICLNNFNLIIVGARAYYFKALIYLKLEKETKAEGYLKKAIEVDNKFYPAYLLLKKIYKEEKEQQLEIENLEIKNKIEKIKNEKIFKKLIEKEEKIC